MTDNQRRAYEASLKIHKKACSLAYKLGGGRLNDPPKRKEAKEAKEVKGER
jgi:hypothetical protein